MRAHLPDAVQVGLVEINERCRDRYPEPVDVHLAGRGDHGGEKVAMGPVLMEVATEVAVVGLGGVGCNGGGGAWCT